MGHPYMVISELEIRLRADIARLQRDMDAARQVVSSATAGMERAANAARAALGGIAASLGGREIIRLADEYTKYTAQLKLATQSEREYSQARKDAKRIANDAQQDLGATGMLYARIANGTRELGVAQSRVADITEVVNLALKVSGAAASESASAQLQLSQAFASGTLRGEEFNAVNEAAPRLMKALADGMGMPVGALKKMAEEGKITSGVMAEVLPGALSQLREESKQVQTIAGAFTVLKNNAMEFVGVQAQANGVVAASTGALTLLANNLTLVAGSVMTLGAAKLGSVIGEWIANTYRQVTAATALRAANIAAAEAEVANTGAKLAQLGSTQAMIVVAREEAMAKLASSNANIIAARTAIAAAEAAGAQSFALRTVRLATAELTVAEAQRSAMLAELAILGRQQASVSAQITAATAAQAAAQTGLNAATGAGIGAAGLASRALGFLGGPIGAVITLLGLAATAWMVWGSKSKDGNQQAAESFEEAHARIVKGLDEQIAKNEKLLQMRNLGATKSEAEKALPFVNQLAAASERLNQINNRTGEFAKQSNTDIDLARIDVLRKITELTEKLGKAETTGAAVAAQSVDERVKAFMKEHATKKEQMDAELKAIENLKGKTSEYGEMVRRIREKYADKGAASALKQEEVAYTNLITSIHEKLAANELEISGFDKLSQSQQMTIKLDTAIATGKNKLNAEHVKEARALIAKVEAQERAIASQQLAAKASEAEAKRDADHYDSLRAGTAAIDDRIKQTEREIEMYGLSASAGVEAEKAKLEAKLAAGPATYAELIALDEQIKKLGTLAKLARNKEALDANKQAAEQMAQEQRQMWESVERTAHDTFISIFESGKSAFDRLTDALKNGLYELLYQMTVKQWLINIGATVTGSGGGIAGVAQTGSAIANGSSALSGISGLAGMTNYAGSAIAGIGNFVGSSSMSAFGAGFAGNSAGMAMTASETFASAGMAAEASAASFGASVASALPYVGALVAAYAIYKKLDDSGTYHTGGASYADASGTRTIRAESIGFEKTRTAADTEKMTAGLVQGIVGILDSTAATFGKTAGYTAATAFADDTSKDGAWGSLVIKNSAGTVLDWNQTRNSGWAPREFDDGQKGQEQYLAEMSKSVRAALDGIGLPSWAQTMLNALGTDAGLDEMAQVVQEINKTQNALKGIGQTMSVFANLSDGVASKLIAAAGGIDALSNSAASYYNNFYSDTEKSAAAMKQVGAVLAQVNLTVPATKEEFRALVEANLALGEGGAKTVAALLSVNDVFSQVIETTGSAGADLSSYRSALTEAYNAESQALQSTITRVGAFATSLRDLGKSALLGNLSPLSPLQKYAEAKSQYEAVLAAARGGDEKAQSDYQGAFTSFLEASRAVFASSDQFRLDFDYAQAATEEAARWAEAQVDVGQAQLDAIKASVAGIVDVKNEVMSLREALLQYNAAKAEQAAPVTAPAPAPIPYYPSEGRTNDAAAEALLYQIEGLRADLQQQTGDQIKAQAQAVADSAVVIAKAVVQPWKFKNDETRVSPE